VTPGGPRAAPPGGDPRGAGSHHGIIITHHPPRDRANHQILRVLRTFGVLRTLGQPSSVLALAHRPSGIIPQPAPVQTTRATHPRLALRRHHPGGDPPLPRGAQGDGAGIVGCWAARCGAALRARAAWTEPSRVSCPA